MNDYQMYEAGRKDHEQENPLIVFLQSNGIDTNTLVATHVPPGADEKRPVPLLSLFHDYAKKKEREKLKKPPEILPDFLAKVNGKIITTHHGGADVTDEWNLYKKEVFETIINIIKTQWKKSL